MKTYNEYNESLRDQMTGKSDKEVQLTLDKSLKELKFLILDCYMLTGEEVDKFINDYYKTIHWSLVHDLKTPIEILVHFEYILYNTFGEERFTKY